MDESLTCPLPGCYADLHLSQSSARPLYVNDLAEGPFDPTRFAPSRAYTATFHVECENGHIILLPGPAGCDCEDYRGPACPHLDTVDWDDDIRTFRANDLDALRHLIRTRVVC